ncbi:WD40 repeat domain-containing protein, partial [Candidatus Babeliales bacterium]|nr:WD40 repeat domain-containing protein [Candidatus Babeliales bacterium]
IDPESNFIIEEELDLADSSLKINNSTLSSKIGTGPIESILDPETYYKELFVVINGIEWRPQNDIIAVAEKFNVGDGVSQLVLYDETLTTTLATNADRAGERIANWDPYGRYIATCTNDGNKVVYLYDQANGNILYVFYIMNNGDVDSFGIEFSPDGRFIAIPEIDAGAPTYLVNIYKFIPEETTKLELVDTISDDSKSAFWSPNGKYLGLINIDSDTLEIYRFNGSSATFVDSASSNVGTAVHTGRVWSPNNRHFAVTRTTEPYIEVYEFDGTTATLVASDSTNIGVGVVWWSYDGKAIAVGANDGCLTVYSFDGSSLTPLEIGGSPSPVDLGQPIRNLAFSRDSEFIGLAKNVDGGSNLAEISLHKNMFSTKQAITSFTSTTSLGILKLNKSLKLKDIQLNLG